MAVSEFNATASAFGFWGFEANFDANLRQAKGDVYWIGTFTGTQIEVFVYAGATYQVRVDGAAEAPITTGSSAYVVAGTGLAEGVHTFQIRVPNNAFFSNRTGTRNWLRVTGAAPAITKTREWKYLTDGLTDGSCRTFSTPNAVVSAASNRTDVVSYGKRAANGGYAGIRFRANATKIYYYVAVDNYVGGYQHELSLLVDGTLHKIDISGLTTNGVFTEVVIDLTAIDADGDHEFVIGATLSSIVYAVGVEGTFGTTITEPPRALAFGDSIVAGFASQGHGWPYLDVLSQRTNIDFFRSGVGGETCAQAVTTVSRITVATVAPDFVFLAHGVNDNILVSDSAAVKNAFKANYTSVINSVLAAYPSCKVVAMGIIPNVNDSGSVYWTTNTLVSEVVTALDDPNVTFFDMIGCSGVATVDGLHPTNPGYVTIADFMESEFRSLVLPSSGGGLTFLSILNLLEEEEGKPMFSATKFAAITKSDSAEVPEYNNRKIKAIYVGGAGDVVITGLDGVDVTLTAVPAGSLLPIRVKFVKEATTATLLIGLY